MSKRCTKCGSFLMDDERFCPNCGENVTEIPVAPAPVSTSQTNNSSSAGYTYSYTANSVQAQPQQQYYAPQQAVKEDKMSFGQWVATVLLTNLLGIVSLVLLFVWGFGSGPEEKRNYCKAMLILYAIGVVLSILMSVVYVALIGSMVGMAGGMIDSTSNQLSALASMFIA